LILGATQSDGAVGISAAGCVIAERLLGQVLAIIQLLGSPTHAQVLAMNMACAKSDLPALPPLPWQPAFRASADAQAVNLVSKLCVFTLDARLRGYESLLHPFFDELRSPQTTLLNGKELPSLFELTDIEATRSTTPADTAVVHRPGRSTYCHKE
jgi:glycogen synthase kinase 3 beta